MNRPVGGDVDPTVGSIAAELAAIIATAVALVASVPQLRRIMVVGDVAGVSLSFATLGVASELAWITYAVHGRLWSAVPEAIAMSAANGVMAYGLVRAGAARRRAVAAAGGLDGGDGRDGARRRHRRARRSCSAWPTPCRRHRRSGPPTGPTPRAVIAAATWALIGLEAALWGVYGVRPRRPCGVRLRRRRVSGRGRHPGSQVHHAPSSAGHGVTEPTAAGAGRS